MALKGTATIELTNADGSKEIIKHDNMITNALSDMCLSLRGETAAILKMTSLGDNYAQTMFGGLLLFDEELNSDPNDYQIPTAKITGYASQDAYAGLDLSRGSFNQSEGGVQADGSYKFVWDFSTSQANGTIKSLGLCPNVMGKIGATDTVVSSEIKDFYFVESPQKPFDSNGWLLNDSGSTNGLSNWSFNIVAIVGDIAYAVDYYNLFYNSSSDYSGRSILRNGGILKLYRFKLGATIINLADTVARARYIDCIDVQLPTSFIGTLYQSSGNHTIACNFNQEESKLIVFPCALASNVAVNGTIQYLDIDLVNNMQITTHTFTNNTADVIKGHYGRGCIGNNDIYYYFYPTKDYILVASGTGDYDKKMYIVNSNDNTYIKPVTYAGSDLIVESITPIFINKNTVVVKTVLNTGQYGWHTMIIDLTTGIAKHTNAANFTERGNISIGNKALFIKMGPYLTYYVTINPFILTTKNNLDAPVQKTASQTMKITYTLSEVAEV